MVTALTKYLVITLTKYLVIVLTNWSSRSQSIWKKDGSCLSKIIHGLEINAVSNTAVPSNQNVMGLPPPIFHLTC